MSYILEALKKSEQERKKKSVPHVNAAAPREVRNCGRRPFWSCVLALALFLNAGLFTWWLRPWHKGQAPADVRASTPMDPQNHPHFSVAEPYPVLPQNHEVPQAQGGEKRTAQGKEGGITDRGEASPSKGNPFGPSTDSVNRAFSLSPGSPSTALKQPALPEAPLAGSESTGHTPPDPSQGEGFQNPGIPPEPSLTAKSESGAVLLIEGERDGRLFREMIAKHLGEQIERMERSTGEQPPKNGGPSSPLSLQPEQPLAFTEKPSPEPEGEKGAPGHLPTINELPASLRSQFSQLSFSGYVYAKNKSDRMIIVNGKVRREGDQIERGLELEEINPHGAVFNYNGTRFRKSM